MNIAATIIELANIMLCEIIDQFLNIKYLTIRRRINTSENAVYKGIRKSNHRPDKVME